VSPGNVELPDAASRHGYPRRSGCDVAVWLSRYLKAYPGRGFGPCLRPLALKTVRPITINRNAFDAKKGFERRGAAVRQETRLGLLRNRRAIIGSRWPAHHFARSAGAQRLATRLGAAGASRSA
jgi:hypothetical protein